MTDLSLTKNQVVALKGLCWVTRSKSDMTLHTTRRLRREHIEALERKGLAHMVDGKWRATNRGLRTMRDISKRDRLRIHAALVSALETP